MTTRGRNVKLFFYGLGCFGLLLFFQNMSFFKASEPLIPKINDVSRLEQAQELLGARYKGSQAQMSEGQYNLQYQVFGKIHQSLPDKWKSKAAEITTAVIEESEKQALDPIFILAVIQTESRFNPDARGQLGDSGLMQILPGTAKWIAEKYNISWEGQKALFDPIYNIKIGVTYFAHLRSEFDSVPSDYLRAYHSGPTLARKMRAKTRKLNAHILSQTYARKVVKNYVKLYKEIGKSLPKEGTKVAASHD